ncbi:MAG TPA: heparinase II/III family protein [Phycisphaeraceae bacterium]
MILPIQCVTGSSFLMAYSPALLLAMCLAVVLTPGEARSEASLTIQDVEAEFRAWSREKDAPLKQASVFFPPRLIDQARANIERYAWAKAIERNVVERAQRWMAFSDDELWGMIFGPTISRAWMVWSDGYCPACKKSVTMYNWALDPFNHPWKVQCPHCKQWFPTNDFEKYYRSGIDEHGVFDPALADRSLLFNVEHPDPSDPLHRFGVDDGEGFVQDGHRWRFIGNYLVKGLWKQVILEGINNLAAAYVVTGDPAYAHKAGILLDRLADLHPQYNGSQLYVYEKNTDPNAYLSPWHDAAPEIRQLALAYDQIFDAIRHDASLVAFLRDKARRYKLTNPKASFADIQRNIENHMFGDVLANFNKINSNYPSTQLTFITIHTVLGWPQNKEQVLDKLGSVIETATAVDGLSGEKGTCVYAATSSHMLADLLGYYQRVSPDFLAGLLQRHPRLHDTYRFHIDTWIMGQFYPNVGDTGRLGYRATSYAGLGFTRDPGVKPSNYSFLWNLYQATADPALVQVIYGANKQSVDGLPYDLFAQDPEAMQQGVQAVIHKHGPDLAVSSVNKQQWCLAIMRSGQGDHQRAFSLAYDAGGRHVHANGMNLDIYAYGYDLMPDFGYPQVQFGGWGSPRARWYTLSAAHNTVTVDGQQQQNAQGQTTLWADGSIIHAFGASCPQMIQGGQRYERNVVMVDIDDRNAYFLDVFRVVGGQRHTYFLHSNFSTLTTPGLTLSPISNPDFGPYAQLRHFQLDDEPQSPWHADWKIDDHYYNYLPEDADLHLRYIPLTSEPVMAGVCEAWVVPSGGFSATEAWLPRLYLERRSDRPPLSSTFVGLLEPYMNSPKVVESRRLTLTAGGHALPESYVAVEVRLADDRRDVLICCDPEAMPAAEVEAREFPIAARADLAHVRQEADGRTSRVSLVNGTMLRTEDVLLRVREGSGLIDLQLERGRAVLLRGDIQAITELRINGEPAQLAAP